MEQEILKEKRSKWERLERERMKIAKLNEKN